MGTRLTILAGLLTGVLVAVVALAAVLAFAPERPVGLATPTPVPSATPGASGAPATPDPNASPNSSPGASGTPGPSATLITTNFRVGEPAPPITVPQLGGGTISLATLAGQPVWVNFMATWCPSCRDEFPLMSGFAARYAPNGLVILAIDVREDESTVASFVTEVGPVFPVGLDLDGSVASDWGAIALPMHFWVDAEGIIRYGAVGAIAPDEMIRGMRAIMPGVEVTP